MDALSRAGVARGGVDGTSYLYLYPSEPHPRYLFPYPTGHDVVGLLPGADPAHRDESVVVMAHYDHLGRDSRRHVFNGAYDDVAGVAAILELARAFGAAGYAPRRTVVWLITDEEESGLRGARAWAKNPTVPRDGIVLGISLDPIGRGLVPGYAFTALFGLEHSPELRERIAASRPALSRGDLLIAHRDLIPHPPFASDHDPFLNEGLPAVWFVNPGFSFYHQVTDEAATIQYDVLLESVRVLAQLVDSVANDDQRYPFVDEPAVEARDLAAFRAPIGGVLGALPDLGRSQRESLVGLDRRLAAIEVSGSFDPAEVEDLGLAAIAQLFTLGVTNPGPIPPPFPAGATAALR
ncbi:MAG: M20/M25/M40 family metallo-hydrolase [Deltaproteobacteria bacterium]|nr:M20/M25/M40 family metallo-hydrolase [Deltaproteobacteria bacterium]